MEQLPVLGYEDLAECHVPLELQQAIHALQWSAFELMKCAYFLRECERLTGHRFDGIEYCEEQLAKAESKLDQLQAEAERIVNIQFN